MRIISIVFGLFLCLNGFAQNTADYALEQKILDCFYRHHEANNIDVRKTIKNLETVFINHKLLADPSGGSYIALIEKIKTGDYSDFTDPGLLTDIDAQGYIPMTVFCKDTSTIKFGAKEIEGSKLKYIMGIYDSLQVAKDVSTTVIAEELLKVITATDLGNDFYKTLELLVVTNMVVAARDLMEEPAPMSSVVKVESRANNSYTILVKKDKVAAQGKAIALTGLKAAVKKFLMESSDQTDIVLPTIGKQKTSAGIIFFQKESSTPIKFYQKVQGEVAKAYAEIRDTYSVKFFKVKFNSLDKKKKQIIMDLVPERISEN